MLICGLAAVLLACGDKEDSGTPEGDVDTDSDSDGDTDADTDVDLDIGSLSALHGSLSYSFNGISSHDDCHRSWELVGTPLVGACVDCDFAFSVDLAAAGTSGDCGPGYGHPEESFEAQMGFMVSHEEGQALVGWLRNGSIYWGAGSVLGPATGEGDMYVQSAEPLSLLFDCWWRDPHGYYYSHSYSGQITVE